MECLRYGLFSFRPEIAAENVFSTMPDSVILVNLKGAITKVNRSLIELTGYTEKELLGNSISQLMQKANVLNQENATPKNNGSTSNNRRASKLRNNFLH